MIYPELLDNKTNQHCNLYNWERPLREKEKGRTLENWRIETIWREERRERSAGDESQLERILSSAHERRALYDDDDDVSFSLTATTNEDQGQATRSYKDHRELVAKRHQLVDVIHSVRFM